VGSVKSYIVAPVFLCFGQQVWVARFVSSLLGAVGLWGWSRGAQLLCGARTGALIAFALAVQPPMTDLVVYDDADLAVSMATLGLSAYMLARLHVSGARRWLVALGIVIGLGIWGRLNFTWIVASMGCAIFLFYWRSIIHRSKDIAIWVSAVALGALPALLFHIRYPRSLATFVQENTVIHSSSDMWSYFGYRILMMSELFISDGERRAIWQGSVSAGCLSQAMSILFWIGLVAAALLRGNQHETKCVRVIGFGGLGVAFLLFVSSLPIAEHHFAILLPFAAASSVAVGVRLATRNRMAKTVSIAIASTYICLCCLWHYTAFISLRDTGGTRYWSSAIYNVADRLESLRHNGPVKILDWGFQDSLEFLTHAKVTTQPIYASATPLVSARGFRWESEVAEGGLFLTSAWQPQSTLATASFESALASSNASFRVEAFSQKNGKPFAVLDLVEPKTRLPSEQDTTAR
jgi:hypothetical protein